MRMCIAMVLAACVLGAAAATAARGAEAPAKTPAAAALEQRVDLDFEKTSLDNVLAYIDEVRRDLKIVIDPQISEVGIDLSTRLVDLRVKQVPVHALLDLVLGPDLAYEVHPGYILVTTDYKALRPQVRLYPVADVLNAVRFAMRQAARTDEAARGPASPTS